MPDKFWKDVINGGALSLLFWWGMYEAHACTVGDFSSYGPVLLISSPLDGVPRVEGLCAMQATENGWVATDTPDADWKILGRFYFYPSPGTYTILTATNVTELFAISYENEFIRFDARGAGGTMVSVTAKPDAWNVIQFVWFSENEGRLWVNADATVDPAQAMFDSGEGTVEDINMGILVGTTTQALFDELLLHRRTVVGPLLMGDANFDGNVNSGDVISIINEYFDADLSTGTPDCNLDGGVNSGDVICVVNTFFTN